MNQLTVQPPADAATPEHPAVTSKALESIMGRLVWGHQGALDFGGGRQARSIDLSELTPSMPSITFASWQLETSDGQPPIRHEDRQEVEGGDGGSICSATTFGATAEAAGASQRGANKERSRRAQEPSSLRSPTSRQRRRSTKDPGSWPSRIPGDCILRCGLAG